MGDDPVLAIERLAIEELRGTLNHMVIGPFTAFCVISAIQLACRHPDVCNTDVGRTVRKLADQLTLMFEPPVRDLIAKGWDPDS